MTEPFSIRKAALSDADEILECLEQAFMTYRSSYTPAGFNDTTLTRETLRKRFTEMTLLVAVDESGRVIGTIGYKIEKNGEGHIRGMAVRPELQGCGAGKKLLDQVEADLRDLRCRIVTLNTTRPLQRAIRFYEKNGYRATGEVGSFFGMDLLAYRKEI